jgi:DNA-binding response OmpR family regulator
MTMIPCSCAPYCKQSAYVVGSVIIECNGIRSGDHKLWLGGRTPQSKIARALAARPGKWVNSQALVDAVYADDPNGGPLSAYDSMRAALNRLKRALAAENFPLTIIGQQGMGYRLVPRKSENAEAA